MEQLVLHQKSLGDTKIFTLEAEHIRIQTKGLGESWDYKVKYELVGFETMYKSETRNRYTPHIFGGSLVLYTVLIANTINEREANMQVQLLFWAMAFLFFLAFFILSFASRLKKYVYLTGGEKTIEMYSNKPDETTVNTFIEAIYKRKRDLEKDKYFEAAKEHMPFEMHEQWLRYLAGINAITKAEQENLLAEAKRFGGNTIGFSFSNN